jgi:L-alanine-DL-glutamate epimerase-like enolase superfamily enzyme
MIEARIDAVGVAIVRAELHPHVAIGDLVLTHREYAVVRVSSEGGYEGWAFGLTRGGAVAETVRGGPAYVYAGTLVNDREATFRAAVRSNPAIYSSGVGMRALSLIDLATWDLAGKLEGLSVAELLGGQNVRMPATAIVGYPPNTMGPEACAAQVSHLRSVGWQRFKAPITATEEGTAARLRAMRRVVPEAWIGLDAAWTYQDADDAGRFLETIADVDLGWFEDVFLPGDIDNLLRLKQQTGVPIAMGDDQSDSYFPGALLGDGAVDVLRFDLTCMGGITRGRGIIQQSMDAGVPCSPHIFGHVHSQVLGGLGYSDVAVEWGMPGTGVDPFSDSLTAPSIAPDGCMEAFPSEPGFGRLINREWVLDQEIIDPDHVLLP